MQWGILLQWFWSSVTLTGNETPVRLISYHDQFWSSVTLTGNETLITFAPPMLRFWSSVTLIGVLSALIHPHHTKAFLSGLLPYDPASYERIQGVLRLAAVGADPQHGRLS